WQNGKPKCRPGFQATLSSSFGTSSPSASRPLSVNQSSRDVGCQSKPTVLRTPSANISRFDPSGFMRRIVDTRGGDRHTLHGAPTDMYSRLSGPKAMNFQV